MGVIHPGSAYALTASSMTHMAVLTQFVLVNFVLNLGFAFPVDHNRQDNIPFVGCVSTWFVV